MVINGVNLPDIDVADALVMERYEHAHDNVAKAMNDLQPEGKRQSELIRAQCTAVFNFFDEVFGDGTDGPAHQFRPVQKGVDVYPFRQRPANLFHARFHLPGNGIFYEDEEVFSSHAGFRKGQATVRICQAIAG